MAQHEIYMKKLGKAIEKREDFDHKECCRDTKENCCAFGQAFYRDVMPVIDSFPQEIKEVILEIEEVHCRFHEIGKKIDTRNPDHKLVEEMRNTSLKLYQLLMKLEKCFQISEFS